MAVEVPRLTWTDTAARRGSPAAAAVSCRPAAHERCRPPGVFDSPPRAPTTAVALTEEAGLYGRRAFLSRRREGLAFRETQTLPAPWTAHLPRGIRDDLGRQGSPRPVVRAAFLNLPPHRATRHALPRL